MTTTYETREELISALRYQLDSGIDTLLVDTPEPDSPFMSADSLLKTEEISPNIAASQAVPQGENQSEYQLQQQHSALAATPVQHARQPHHYPSGR